MYVPVFGKERYTIQEIKRACLGATTVDDMQPGKGGQGKGVGVIYGLVSTQKQHVCGLKEMIKEISVFF